MSKALFLLKRREDFHPLQHSKNGLSTGLFNSASFVCDMLGDAGVESKLVVCIDNNDIDREVTQYKPSHVIIEALWVVPTKFTVLRKLHPGVTWIIRLHSELPFMAGEGMAMDWLGDYSQMDNVVIAANAPRMLEEVRVYLKTKNHWSQFDTEHKVIYLPNYYPDEFVKKPFDHQKDEIHIGCFGAVRLLKNHLSQAIASIEFANRLGKKLKFHINAGRIEMQGQPVLNNLKGVFEHLYGTGHELINHAWSPREDFLKTCATMDIGMQVNFSETFNIVGADLLSQGVPVIGTSEIPWMNFVSIADPNEMESIISALYRAYNYPQVNVLINKWMLQRYISNTRNVWYNYFKETK